MYVYAVLGDTVWVSTTSRLVTSTSVSDVQGSNHLYNLDVSNFLPFPPHIFGRLFYIYWECWNLRKIFH